MKTEIPLLNNVKVAAPCQQNWNDMVGGDRVRYCRSCEKNVYNLSEMSEPEAEKLLQTHEGRLCVRFYQRADGKIMTNNCPVGLRAIRRAYVATATRVGALCSVLFGTFRILPAAMMCKRSDAPARVQPEWTDTATPYSTQHLPEERWTQGMPAMPFDEEERKIKAEINEAANVRRKEIDADIKKAKAELKAEQDDDHDEDSTAR